MRSNGEGGVGVPRSDPQTSGDRTVVIGAGLAGLVTARILANHFARVTVIERDRLPARPTPRPGVPQSHHLQILLARGMAVLEQLFPGLESELLAAGALTVDIPGDMLWLSPSGWAHRFHPGLALVCCTRPLLEWMVRRRLTSFNGVRFLEAHEVTGLEASPDRMAVTGVGFEHAPPRPGAGRRPAR